MIWVLFQRARFKNSKRNIGKEWRKKMRKKPHSSVTTVSEDYIVVCTDGDIVSDYNFSWTHSNRFPGEFVNEGAFSTYL